MGGVGIEEKGCEGRGGKTAEIEQEHYTNCLEDKR